MLKHPLARLDRDEKLRQQLLPFCRLKPGEIWRDRKSGHGVGCLDATSRAAVSKLCAARRAVLAIHDLPYNFIAFEQKRIDEFIGWCREVVSNTEAVLSDDSSLYLWIGADQRAGFAPLPELMMMMRQTAFRSRSFITLRNQRGYGTQQNWMSVRQELLYYTKGKPKFSPQYTELPKAVRGYYKEISGEMTENAERGRGGTLRAGNVWVDVQQVFYRMEENVNGCYAQKPLKAIRRIIEASSSAGDLVLDFFAHSGTTLLATEMIGRTCLTMDIDPIFCEITIRRLEHFRRTGRTGWQNSNPFARELGQAEEHDGD
ncbi:MAG TPA: site-specific DNA-methyltransferase [Blastocatellia bacterium]|nr:site-specific DNA-methyltransferase [Blastocatellia bacterium]HMV87746.1 site-specific DNA-methyltransferase [Blastocatellia bacterium]HMX24836.1 site-specific DNA-methyltransferase [Blastocatellia bacterium]HMY71019.1 site-specific DNA-methyltransferase [Blastocatellia bacterium]HMZ16721.1 site-specific DNA-methyltransferase [Blastocatellia bacterium]